MSEFNRLNWLDALSALFTRSVTDDQYRQLCLTDPRAAVAAVSDIDLPDSFQFGFVNAPEDVFQSMLLPPALGAAAPSPDALKKLMDWPVYCTDTFTHSPS